MGWASSRPCQSSRNPSSLSINSRGLSRTVLLGWLNRVTSIHSNDSKLLPVLIKGAFVSVLKHKVALICH
ncbi:hypothetical protein CCMA1212_000507 [Trichoderma ghanense]|uniref:Uncharacterized protein n=1 Tax=Trichoderma ghanense TaxID=65468 RepID=A0ABY2HGA8_9HYPO